MYLQWLLTVSLIRELILVSIQKCFEIHYSTSKIEVKVNFIWGTLITITDMVYRLVIVPYINFWKIISLVKKFSSEQIQDKQVDTNTKQLLLVFSVTLEV